MNGLNGAGSPGRGTTERVLGTKTASQDSEWGPSRSAASALGIGPRDVLCTVAVWYVSHVFSTSSCEEQEA